MDPDKVADEVATRVVERMDAFVQRQQPPAAAKQQQQPGEWSEGKKVLQQLELTLGDFASRLDRLFLEERNHVEGRLQAHENLLTQHELRLASQLERFEPVVSPPASLAAAAEPAPAPSIGAVGQVMGTVEASMKRLEAVLMRQQRDLPQVQAAPEAPRTSEPARVRPFELNLEGLSELNQQQGSQRPLESIANAPQNAPHGGDHSPASPGDQEGHPRVRKFSGTSNQSTAKLALNAPVLNSPRSTSRTRPSEVDREALRAESKSSVWDLGSEKTPGEAPVRITKAASQMWSEKDILDQPGDKGHRRNSVMGMPLAELEHVRGGLEHHPSRRIVFDYALQVVLWWENLREPPRRGELARIVMSRIFELVSLTVILVNAGFMVYVSDKRMAGAGMEVRSAVVEVGELAFLSWYSVEVLLRIVVHRLFFFVGNEWCWNVFDFVLVLVALYIEVLGFLFTGPGSSGGTSALRALRLMKLAKVLRAFRIMRYLSFFNTVKLIVNAVVGSWISFFWSLVMIAFLFYLVAILFVQSLADFLLREGDALDGALKDQILLLFGSVSTSMLTLFKGTFGGRGWDDYYVVLDGTDKLMSFGFLIFVVFMKISVFNIMTSLFIEMTMRLAAPDTQTLARQKRHKEREESRELWNLVKKLDPDDTGLISAWRFTEMMEHPHIRHCFSVLGLDLRSTEEFFDMLGFVSGDSTVDIDTFVEGCMRMKGEATGLVQQTLLMETKLVRRAQRELALILSEKIDIMDKRISEASAIRTTNRKSRTPTAN